MVDFFLSVFQQISQLFHPDQLAAAIQQWGWLAYVILFIIVFAETGLLIGFFLPGDSLLFIAGFVCSIETAEGHVLNIVWLNLLLITAAIVGDSVGYLLGKRIGPAIFCKEDSLLFHKKHLIRTQLFYEKYGGRTIIYARFVPIVRTFAPFVAGIGNMHYKRFISFNVFGGIGWVMAMTLLGYFLGNVPIVKNNLERAVLLVIFISILPILFEIVKSRFHNPQGPEENAATKIPTE